MEEVVDILTPPTFEKSGVSKPRSQAWADGDWIGTFNLWILQRTPLPAIVYQVRSPRSSWAPNKFDVTAGGHYVTGESLPDGLREVREELGKVYKPTDLTYLGRKMHVSPDVHGIVRQNIVDISFIVDDSPLDSYLLDEHEVYALCSLSIADLIKVHTQPGFEFEVNLLTASGESKGMIVNQDSFPYNWDNYHFKVALLADRFLKGEQNLVY